ncbi:hypothetical protein STCU_10503 [Strigomonas culicis]|uniref:Uncharacterized protein n=1 Tax=Strigomonas culicis TaxID=28005 RepID=S9V463_9TRYP|nr:hypothetical protein STCU_10503 [Strigomonas culicis]|eukprot:EPY17625.1 hypothetical protein STCU_10503 [Strigomonas culicis]
MDQRRIIIEQESVGRVQLLHSMHSELFIVVKRFSAADKKQTNQHAYRSQSTKNYYFDKKSELVDLLFECKELLLEE